MHCTDERSASPHKIAVQSSSYRGRSASVAAVPTPVSAIKTPTCCNCFGPLKSSNQWDDAISNQMSEVYCRACEDDDDQMNTDQYVRIPKDRLDSPAILTNITNRTVQRRQNAAIATASTKVTKPKEPNSVCCGQNELETPTTTTTANERIDKESSECNRNIIEDYELGDDAVVDVTEHDDTLNGQLNAPKNAPNKIDSHEMIRCRGKEELPEVLVASKGKQIEQSAQKLCHSPKNRPTFLNSISLDDTVSSDSQTDELKLKVKTLASKQMPNKIICTNDHPLIPKKIESDADVKNGYFTNTNSNDCNGNQSAATMMTASVIVPKKPTVTDRMSILKGMHRMYSTLPRMKKVHTTQPDAAHQPPYSIPMRTTPDGTSIYYLCDLSKNVIKGADSISYSLNF